MITGMARLHDVVFDCRHPASIARFWAAALDGYEVAPYDEAELARLPQVKLYPGMPATVMITTEARTAFEYFLGPLVASFNKSFRQK